MVIHQLFQHSYRLQQIFNGNGKLSKGDCCEEVRLLQVALKALDYSMPKSFGANGPDGQYGNECKATVGLFQSEYGVACKKSGEVDRATMEMLNSEVPADTEKPGAWPGFNTPAVLKENVLKTLKSGPVSYLYFTTGSTYMFPSHMNKVHDAIAGDRIPIKLFGANPGKVPWGQYNQKNDGNDPNTLFLNPHYGMSSWIACDPAFFKSVVIHESIHALHDIEAFGLSVLDSEVAAYISQAIYYRSSTRRGILKAPGYLIQESDRPILKAADDLAIYALYGKELNPDNPADAAVLETTPPYKSFLSELYVGDLEDAIKNHSLYQNNYWEPAGFDGA